MRFLILVLASVLAAVSSAYADECDRLIRDAENAAYNAERPEARADRDRSRLLSGMRFRNPEGNRNCSDLQGIVTNIYEAMDAKNQARMSYERAMSRCPASYERELRSRARDLGRAYDQHRSDTQALASMGNGAGCRVF